MFLVLAYCMAPSPPRDELAAWSGVVIDIAGRSADADTTTGNISGLVWRIGRFEDAIEMRLRLVAHGITATAREQ